MLTMPNKKYPDTYLGSNIFILGGARQYGQNVQKHVEKIAHSLEVLIVNSWDISVRRLSSKQWTVKNVHLYRDHQLSENVTSYLVASVGKWKDGERCCYYVILPGDEATLHLVEYMEYMELWPSGLRRRARDPMVVSSKPRSDISVEVTSRC